MTGTAFRFIIAAPILLLIGMIWGLHMAASQDHTMTPAHAHLNLVGGVLFAIFGIYYHVVPSAAQLRVTKLHFPVALIGIGFMIPGIAIAHSGGNPVLAIIGSVLSALSMGIFLLTVIRSRV